MRGRMLAVAAAISMISVSSVAAAQSSAAPLSLASAVAANAERQDASDYRGGIIIPALVVLAIGALIYVLTKGDSSESP